MVKGLRPCSAHYTCHSSPVTTLMLACWLLTCHLLHAFSQFSAEFLNTLLDKLLGILHHGANIFKSNALPHDGCC